MFGDEEQKGHAQRIAFVLQFGEFCGLNRKERKRTYPAMEVHPSCVSNRMQSTSAFEPRPTPQEMGATREF